MKDDEFGISKKTMDKIVESRYVELVNFVLMPNHIHLILREKKVGGISKMMQRSLDGFTRYTHVKYKKSGHIFEGPFKAIYIKDNTQLLYLSSYIHKNPKEISNWKKYWKQYPWSSYKDFVGENRWGNLLSRKVILKQFRKPE